MKWKTRWGNKGTYLLVAWAIFWLLGFVPMAMPRGIFPNAIEPKIIGLPIMILWEMITVGPAFMITLLLCYMRSNTLAEDM